MKKTLRKLFAAALVGALSVSMLAGCGSSMVTARRIQQRTRLSR